MKPSARPPLGQLLYDAGLPSAQDLRKALSAQLICGGKIGTSLIELEMVPIDQVSRHLAAQLDLPEATPQILDRATDEVLSLVPRELCSRYKVIPLGLEGRLLKLAMLEPLDLAQVDELSFVTGLRIQPMVAPELRLYYLLERHFGLERPSRYLRIPEDEPLCLETPGSRPQRRRYLEPLELPPLEPMDPAPAPGDPYASRPAGDTFELTIDVAEEVVDPGAPEQRSAPADEDDLGLVYLDSFTDLPAAGAPAAPGQPPLEQALSWLQQAQSPQAVATALVQPVASGTALSVLFLVRGKALVGVAAHGTESTAEEVGELVVSLTPRSMLRQAYEQRAVVCGSGQDPFMQLVASYLGASAPAGACVAPVLAGQQVVQLLCTLYADTPLAPDAARDLQRLCAHATKRYASLVSHLAR